MFGVALAVFVGERRKVVKLVSCLQRAVDKPGSLLFAVDLPKSRKNAGMLYSSAWYHTRKVERTQKVASVLGLSIHLHVSNPFDVGSLNVSGILFVWFPYGPLNFYKYRLLAVDHLDLSFPKFGLQIFVDLIDINDSRGHGTQCPKRLGHRRVQRLQERLDGICDLHWWYQ